MDVSELHKDHVMRQCFVLAALHRSLVLRSHGALLVNVEQEVTAKVSTQLKELHTNPIKAVRDHNDGDAQYGAKNIAKKTEELQESGVPALRDVKEGSHMMKTFEWLYCDEKVRCCTAALSTSQWRVNDRVPGRRGCADETLTKVAAGEVWSLEPVDTRRLARARKGRA
jgi:hypothetical protein